jgi:NAD(P)-dependent dehydrogenase (short-subunit alcohol dehydrogenase family)
MNSSLTRPLAVVTGASNGIGYEPAKQFAQNGFDLLVTSTGSSINEASFQSGRIRAVSNPRHLGRF